MKTTIEVLDEISKNPGYKNWKHLLREEEGCDANITAYVEQAMRLYAQQFIDAANEIIGPACDVLDENYDEEYENWHNIQTINEDEDN